MNEPLAMLRPRVRSATSLVVAPLLVAVLSVVVPREPFAQSLIAQAQSLFDQGQELLSAGKFAEACAAFQASHKLDPAVTTLLNLADCRAQNAQLATAWGLFLEAERMANATANKKLATIAARHAARLKPRLSKLVIVVPSDHQVPGLLLLRGDEPIDPATWNHALPVDGGPYQLTAKAPGRQPWTTTIQINPERDVQTIEIPSFSAESRPLQVAPKPADPPGASPATQPEPNHRTPSPIPPKPAMPSLPTSNTAPPKPTESKSATPPVSSSNTTQSVPPAPTPASPIPNVTTATSAPMQSRPPVASVSAFPKNNGEKTSISEAQPADKPTVISPGSSSTSKPRDSNAKAPPLPSLHILNPMPKRHSRILPLVLGASSLALTAGAIAFKLSGDRYYDRAKTATTQEMFYSHYDAANTHGYVAQVLTGAAVACAGTAVYLYLKQSREAPRSRTTKWIPIVSTQQTSVTFIENW